VGREQLVDQPSRYLIDQFESARQTLFKGFI